MSLRVLGCEVSKESVAAMKEADGKAKAAAKALKAGREMSTDVNLACLGPSWLNEGRVLASACQCLQLKHGTWHAST